MLVDGLAAERFFALVRAAVERFGSQTEAAGRLGISQSYVSRILKGKALGSVQWATLAGVGYRFGVLETEWGQKGDPPEAWALRVIERTPADAKGADMEQNSFMLASFAYELVRASEQPTTSKARAAELARRLAKLYSDELGTYLARQTLVAGDDDATVAMGVALAKWLLRGHEHAPMITVDVVGENAPRDGKLFVQVVDAPPGTRVWTEDPEDFDDSR